MARQFVMLVLLALCVGGAYWSTQWNTQPDLRPVRVLVAPAPLARNPASVVFVGDSLTARLDTQVIVPGSRNYGFPGIRTSGLPEAIAYYGIGNAPVAFLSVGTNDVVTGRVAGIEARLRAISDSLPMPLFWSAIPPTGRGSVEAVNAIIRRICEERRNCVYVEAAYVAGDLFGDGVHMSPAGRARWTAALRQALTQKFAALGLRDSVLGNPCLVALEQGAHAGQVSGHHVSLDCVVVPGSLGGNVPSDSLR